MEDYAVAGSMKASEKERSYAGVGSRKAAEKERSYAGAGTRKAAKERASAGAGSKKVKRDREAVSGKAKKERGRSMLKNLELDEEKAHTGSKMEKEKVPLDEFPFSFKPGPGQKEGVESGQSKAGVGKRRKKTYRLGMEYIDFVAEFPLPQLCLPFPGLVDPGISELQERFVAGQLAEREERDNIIKQIKEFGYADVEIEVPYYYQDPLRRDGCWYGGAKAI